MLTRMLFRCILVIGMTMLGAPAAWAGFSTYSNNWPDDAATVGENVPPPQPVKVVVNSNLKPKSVNKCPKRVPENKRLYLKFGINQSSTQLRHIMNNSSSPLAGLPVSQDSLKQTGLGWEVGAGTKYEMARLEVDYIYQKTLNYNPAPVLAGNAASLVSTIKNNALLINLFWDFDNFKYVSPYIGALTGVVWNESRSTLTGGGVGTGAAENNSYVSVAWGFMAGMRIPFWERWYTYMQYRYTDQSRVYWKDSTSIFKLRGDYVFTGFSLGVNYVL